MNVNISIEVNFFMFIEVWTTLGASKVYMNLKGVHSFCLWPDVVYTLINLRKMKNSLALLHSERPKLYTILAFVNVVGLSKGRNVDITLKSVWVHITSSMDILVKGSHLSSFKVLRASNSGLQELLCNLFFIANKQIFNFVNFYSV